MEIKKKLLDIVRDSIWFRHYSFFRLYHPDGNAYSNSNPNKQR